MINITDISCKLRITCAVLLSEERWKREGKKVALAHTGTWILITYINKGRTLIYEKLHRFPNQPYSCDIYTAQAHVLHTQLQEPSLILKCCWCKVSNPPSSGMTITHCSYFHPSLANTLCPSAHPAWQNSPLSQRARGRSVLHLVVISVTD